MQGRFTEAIVAHRRGLNLLERLLGPNDSRVAMTLTNLGLAHADAGQVAAAVAAQSRAHAIFQAALGSDHASTVLAATRWAAATGSTTPDVRLLDDAEEQESAAAG